MRTIKYLKDDNFMSVCNENTNKAIKNTQQKIMERQKLRQMYQLDLFQEA